MNNKLAHIIHRVAMASLDPVIRVKILEGAAGVHPDIWARRPDGLVQAQRWFEKENITIPEEWFDRRGQKFYNALFQGAMKILHSAEEAEDLIANIISGFSRSQAIRGGQLYEVGANLMATGDLSPARARGWLGRHTTQRAISLSRQRNRQDSLSMTNEDGDTTVLDLPAQIDNAKTLSNILDWLSSPEGGDVYRMIRSTLAKEWAKAPSKLEVFDTMVNNPTLNNVGIARVLRPVPDDSPGSWVQYGASPYVGKIRTEVTRLIPSIISRNKELMSDIDLRTELTQLGYGQARMARKAANLAILLRQK